MDCGAERRRLAQALRGWSVGEARLGVTFGDLSRRWGPPGLRGQEPNRRTQHGCVSKKSRCRTRSKGGSPGGSLQTKPECLTKHDGYKNVIPIKLSPRCHPWGDGNRTQMPFVRGASTSDCRLPIADSRSVLHVPTWAGLAGGRKGLKTTPTMSLKSRHLENYGAHQGLHDSTRCRPRNE